METQAALKAMIIKAKGLVFDMDGTLLALPVDWDAAKAELMELSGRTEFAPTFETLGEVVRSRPDLRAQLLRILDRFEMDAEPRATLYEGSKGALELLSDGSRLALVTMQGSQVRDSLLRRFDLARFFTTLICREDFLVRSLQLEMAVSRLGLRKHEVVFVADRIHDMNSAKKAGLRFVMIRGRRPSGVEGFSTMKSFFEFLSRSR